MNETMVTVVGNVATDLRSRRVGDDGDRVVSFRVVSNERRRDRATGAWIDGDRFSASVSCWRRLADGAFESLVKGDPVVVTGRLSLRDYEVDGERRTSADIEASAVGPDLARSTAEVHRRRRLEAVAADGPAGSDGPESLAHADEVSAEQVAGLGAHGGDQDVEVAAG